MAELKDSGARRSFDTGAVRDIAEGKGRCDLIPLKQAADICDDAILGEISDYMEKGETKYLRKAVTIFSALAFGNIWTGMLEVAKQYEDGCQKYGERNWQKGIPSHVYIDSGVRHYLKWRRGDDDEPHDRAFLWNLLGALWTHETKPELIDLPFAVTENPATEEVEPWGEEDEVRAERLFKCRNGSDCLPCPMASFSNRRGLLCSDFFHFHPAEARKIMDEMEGKK